LVLQRQVVQTCFLTGAWPVVQVYASPSWRYSGGSVLLIMVLVDRTWRCVERIGKNEKTMSGELEGANIRSFFSADVASISMVACSVVATRDC
jgi:hypothetical protein